MDCVRAAMQKLPRNPENVCIDEQIVPFSGGMPNKVVIKSELHPFGLKLYCLADPSGTVLDFVAYSGKTTITGEMVQRPQGEPAVLTLTESVSENSVIYLDRFLQVWVFFELCLRRVSK